jgi:hypothetical protein
MSGGDGLFEVGPMATVEPRTVPTVPVNKAFRAFAPGQLRSWCRRRWVGGLRLAEERVPIAV